MSGVPTPGPWHARPNPDQIGDDREWDIFVGPPDPAFDDTDRWFVAVVCGGMDGAQAANARLIAAAPEMHHALDRIRDAALHGYLTPDLCAELVMTALAKAEAVHA